MSISDRPNQHVAAKVREAQTIAAGGKREVAAQYLLEENIPLPVIARVLATGNTFDVRAEDAAPHSGET